MNKSIRLHLLLMFFIAASASAVDVAATDKTIQNPPTKIIKLKELRSVCAFSPSGNLAACAKDDAMIVFDLAAERDVLTTDGYNAEFTSDEQSISTIQRDGKTIKVCNLASGKQKLTKVDQDDPFPMARTPDGKMFILDQREQESRAKKIAFYDVVTGKIAFELPYEHGDAVHAISFSDDGTRLAALMNIFVGTVAFGIEPVNVWDVSTAKLLLSFAPHATDSCGDVYGIAISHDGKTLATTGCDNTLRVWDIATGKELFEKELVGLRDQVGRGRLLLFSHDDSLISIDVGKSVCVFDWAQKRSIMTLNDGNSTPTVVAFSKNDLTILVGGSDHAIRIWPLPLKYYLNSRLKEEIDDSHSFTVPQYATYSSDNVLVLLSAKDKQAILEETKSHAAEVEPYSIKSVYGVTPTTGGPYSIPPPRAAIYVYKGTPSLKESRELDITILTDDYVMIAGVMIRSHELVLSLMKIIEANVPKK